MLIEEDSESNGRFYSPARQSLQRDSFLEQVERENEALEKELRALGTPESRHYRPVKAQDKQYLRKIREDMDEFERQLQESDPTVSADPVSFKLTGRSLTPSHFRASQSMSEPSKPLESRLKAANEAVLSLTKLLKDKDKKVKELAAELEHKERTLQLLTSQAQAASGYQKSITLQSASVSVLRSREKELESKLKSQETKITEDKKLLRRLQDVNKALIARIKTSNQHITATAQQLNPAKSKKIRSLEQENQELYLENRRLKEELHGLETELMRERGKYEELQRNAIDFEAKARDLYRANQLLNQNLVKVMNSQ